MNIQPSELWCDCMEAVEKIGSDGDYAHTNTQNTEMVYSLCSPSVVYVWPEPSHVWQTAFGRWTDCTRFAERSTYYSLVIKKNIQTIKFGVHLSVESRQIKWFSACKYTILSWVPKRNWQRVCYVSYRRLINRQLSLVVMIEWKANNEQWLVDKIKWTSLVRFLSKQK